MRKISFDIWYIKSLFLFLVLYLWNNAYLYLISKIGYKLSHDIVYVLIYIVSYVFLIVVVAIFYNSVKNVYKNHNSNYIYHFIILLIIIYLTGFIKSDFNLTYKIRNIEITNSFLIVFVSQIFIAPILEEYFFRGVLLNNFIQKKKILIGVILTSILFSLAHFPLLFDKNTFSLINFFDITIFGIILAIIRVFLGLKYSIIAHSFRNLLIFFFNYKILDLFLIDKISSKNLFDSVYIISIVVIIGIILYYFSLLNKKVKV